jgi:hypothetical protein
MVTNEACVREGKMDVTSDDIYKITRQAPATARGLAEQSKDFLIEFMQKFGSAK